VVRQADKADGIVEWQQLEPAHAEHWTSACKAEHFCERTPTIHRA
jgi:hypothetical protein